MQPAVKVLTDLDNDLTDRAQWIKRFVASRCPSYLFDQRDDICQEALMRIMRAQQRQQDDSTTINSSYLRQAAMSAIVDAIRRLRTKPDGQVDEQALESRKAERPDSTTERHQVLDKVYKALESFSERRRKHLLLYLRGVEINEIVELTLEKYSTVRNDIYRGRASLAKMLNQQGVDYEIE